QGVRRESASGVEAEPSEPQRGGAEHHVGDGVRPTGQATDALPAADYQRGGDRRDARGGMDDQSAGEVDDPEGLEPSAEAPVPVGDGHVDERRPRDDVYHERLEADPLREGANDQGRRDRGELQLKREIKDFRDRVRIGGIRCRTYVVETEIV